MVDQAPSSDLSRAFWRARELLAEEDAGTLDAYQRGTLGRQLAEQDKLLVISRSPISPQQVHFLLLPGTISGVPRTLQDLERTARESEGSQHILKGGIGADFAVFRKVKVGTYSLCIIASAPLDPATASLIKAATDTYEADNSSAPIAERLKAALAKAVEATGAAARPPDWSGSVVRVHRIEVTDDPESRVVISDLDQGTSAKPEVP